MSKSTFEEEIQRNGFLCYSIYGVSMQPLLYQHRDIVTVKKPEGRLNKYDVALYKMPDGRYILHRVIKVREDDYVICGDNCIRREYGITDDNILGVMTEFVRNGKRYSVDSCGYHLYSHIIVDFYHLKAPALWCKMMVKRVISKIWRTLNIGNSKSVN